MKLPKKINICGHWYKIQRVGPEALDPSRAAECEWPTRIIRICKEVKGEMVFMILLHEIRHAYQYESGLAQILQAQAMETDADGFASLVTSLKEQKLI